MTEREYIEKVKVKLDEFSPFDEPSSFIAANGEDTMKVKPIVAYIENELQNAVHYCLSFLPQSILSKDITKSETSFSLNGRVGVVASTENIDWYAKRLIRVQVPNYWKRDVTAFMKSEDSGYLLQQNEHTRGGDNKPVVVYVAEKNELELYSFPKKLEGEGEDTDWTVNIWYIDTLKTADEVASNIEDFIIIKCAQLVADILGNTNAATALDKEYQRKVAAL